MGLCVTFVSGPEHTGKTAVIGALTGRLRKRKPHYLRLAKNGTGNHSGRQEGKPLPEFGLPSIRWVEYDEEHIFEILPEALANIHRQDRFGSVVVEGDADPSLRCAYPYDYRIFVMPLPSMMETVFRDQNTAAAEFSRVLDDTQAFASEVFGLHAGDGHDDCEPSEDRATLSNAQMQAFLYSPLGDELATRIQLQPPYHGLVESDVVIVNTRIGQRTSETDDCLHRIEMMVKRSRSNSSRKSQLFRCDPCNQRCPVAKKLLKALEPMCRGGK